MVPPVVLRALPFRVWMAIAPGVGPAAGLKVSVPLVTLVAFVIRVAAMLVPPTTILSGGAVTGGGTAPGPTVACPAASGARPMQAPTAMTAANRERLQCFDDLLRIDDKPLP
jgi:hypothetical protein